MEGGFEVKWIWNNIWWGKNVGMHFGLIQACLGNLLAMKWELFHSRLSSFKLQHLNLESYTSLFEFKTWTSHYISKYKIQIKEYRISKYNKRRRIKKKSAKNKCLKLLDGEPLNPLQQSQKEVSHSKESK